MDISPPSCFPEDIWRYFRSHVTADTFASSTPRAHLPFTDTFWHMHSADQQRSSSSFQVSAKCPSQLSILPKDDLAVCHLTNCGPQDGQQIANISKSERGTRSTALKKVPRPLNSFILYRKDRQEITKQDHPSLCNNDISKILGKQWKTETEEIRTFYKSKAEAAKLAHVTQYPEYQYCPRRPEEKKRRMTKNKKRKMEQVLQADQIMASMANDQFDPFLLEGWDTGYMYSSHSEGQSLITNAPIGLNSRDFDFDSATRTAAESKTDAFPG